MPPGLGLLNFFMVNLPAFLFGVLKKLLAVMALVMLLPLPNLEAYSDIASAEERDAAGGMAAASWMAADDDWVGDGKCLGVGRKTVAGSFLAYISDDWLLSSASSAKPEC